MTDYLKLAISRINATKEQVLSSNQLKDRLVLIVDYGIAGAKKYSFLLTELEHEDDAVEAEAKKVDALKEKLALGRKRG